MTINSILEYTRDTVLYSIGTEKEPLYANEERAQAYLDSTIGPGYTPLDKLTPLLYEESLGDGMLVYRLFHLKRKKVAGEHYIILWPNPKGDGTYVPADWRGLYGGVTRDGETLEDADARMYALIDALRSLVENHERYEELLADLRYDNTNESTLKYLRAQRMALIEDIQAAITAAKNL